VRTISANGDAEIGKFISEAKLQSAMLLKGRQQGRDHHLGPVPTENPIHLAIPLESVDAHGQWPLSAS
jgi:hypothetical protein